jgi:hypothetical protein
MPTRSERPSTLMVETTVRCNLRCPQTACIPNNDRAIRTRDSDFLGVDSFRRIVDELAGGLHHVFSTTMAIPSCMWAPRTCLQICAVPPPMRASSRVRTASPSPNPTARVS